jgi:amino acid transporter
MSEQPTPSGSDIAQRDSHQLRRGTLGVLGVAFFVVSAAAPLTAMAGGAPVAMLLGNGPGIPAAYVVVSLILIIFSVGYTAMARHHTSTGAFYSYVARGLKQPAGGAAAIIALLGYNAMQIGLYGLFGAAASGFFSDVLGLNVPWWVFVFVAMAIIGVCGYRQVDLSAKILAVLVSLEFLIVLVLDVAILIKGGEGAARRSRRPRSPPRVSSAAQWPSRCCSTSPRSSGSRRPPSTARRRRTRSVRCHGRRSWPY